MLQSIYITINSLGILCFLIFIFYKYVSSFFCYNLIINKEQKEIIERLEAFLLDNKEKIFYNEVANKFILFFEKLELMAFIANTTHISLSYRKFFTINNSFHEGYKVYLKGRTEKINLFYYLKTIKILRKKYITKVSRVEEYETNIQEARVLIGIIQRSI